MLLKQSWKSDTWCEGGSYRKRVRKPKIAEKACLDSSQHPKEREKKRKEKIEIFLRVGRPIPSSWLHSSWGMHSRATVLGGKSQYATK